MIAAVTKGLPSRSPPIHEPTRRLRWAASSTSSEPVTPSAPYPSCNADNSRAVAARAVHVRVGAGPLQALADEAPAEATALELGLRLEEARERLHAALEEVEALADRREALSSQREGLRSDLAAAREAGRVREQDLPLLEELDAARPVRPRRTLRFSFPSAS